MARHALFGAATLNPPPARKSAELKPHPPGRHSKASYLLRDTLKVVGSPALALAPATLAIFFVNPDRPTGGGTGHTIRICQLHAVPAATQSDWTPWLPNAAN
jgi:hypothetical protein